MRILFLCLLIAGYFSAAGQGKKPKKPGGMVYEKIEIVSGFPGGDTAWIRFVERNFDFNAVTSRLPDSVLEFRDSIYVQFVISKKGFIKNLETTTPLSVFFKDEILKLLKRSPKWIPAFQGGWSVNSYKSYLFVIWIMTDTGNIEIIPSKFPKTGHKIQD